MKNIDLIDTLRAHQSHSPGDGLLCDALIKLLPFLLGELFRVIDIKNVRIRRQNDSAGSDRSGQRASPRLVDATDISARQIIAAGCHFKGADIPNPFLLPCDVFHFLRGAPHKRLHAGARIGTIFFYKRRQRFKLRCLILFLNIAD